VANRIPHISEPLFDAGSQKVNDNWFRFLDQLASDLASAQATLATARTQGKTTLWVPASQMVPGAGPPTLGTVTFGGGVVASVMQLDPTNFETAHFQVALPKSWDEGTISAQFYWAHPATVTNFGVRWGLFAQALSDDDAMDNTFNSVGVSDVGGTTSDLYISAETPALTPSKTAAEGDMLALAISRTPADASDTMAVDAYLIGIKLFFTTNAGNDA
jgi:hypothetical protein